ncbi:MFS transporter [Paenibacillus sp. GYB003]|uniref:MFS transporter n=1 Tax=Paenibacillus sp. GYB003 TaxID=2994392 RepID=UPI002F969ED9
MLRNRYVGTILLSRTVLQLGIWVRNFAILLYVTDMTNNDPLYVSLISVAEFAPIFVFAIIGGTFADRWRPKRTMIWCDVLSAVSVLVVLLVVILGSWHALLFAALCSAILSQFSQPSAMKLFKRHVPEEQLQGTMAMYQTAMTVFTVIGPAIGTFVYQTYGIEVSIGITVVMFLASAFILSFLPRDEERGAASAGSFKQEMTDGLRYVWSNRTLRLLGGSFAASGLAVGLIQPLMLYVALENLQSDKPFLQWLIMVNGAAMLVGGAVMMSAAKKISPQALLATGLVVSAVGTVGIGWSDSIPLTLALRAVTGFVYPTILVGINTMILRNTEAAFVGRVGGALSPLFMGMMVVGMSAAGALKQSFSLFAVFGLSGLLFVFGGLLLLPLFGEGRAKAPSGAGQS